MVDLFLLYSFTVLVDSCECLCGLWEGIPCDGVAEEGKNLPVSLEGFFELEKLTSAGLGGVIDKPPEEGATRL